MKGLPNNAPDAGRLNEAAIWQQKLSGSAPDGAVWLEFTAWLEADAANRIAFDRVEDLYVALDEAEPLLVPSLAADGLDDWHAVPRAFVIGGVALLAAVLVLAVGIDMRASVPRVAHYETRLGETRHIVLSDGSAVELGAASAIDTAMGDERRISLTRGEAIFQVASNPGRPFIVTAGNSDVRDVGTVFNVLQDPGRTVVTVAEGSVAVWPLDRPGETRPVQVAAGEQMIALGNATGQVRKVDPATALAWRQGFLTYQNAPLAEVVGDLNRYFEKKIVVKDKDTGARSFSGALKIDNEEAVLNRLAELLPLIVERDDSGVITLRLKPQAD